MRPPSRPLLHLFAPFLRLLSGTAGDPGPRIDDERVRAPIDEWFRIFTTSVMSERAESASLADEFSMWVAPSEKPSPFAKCQCGVGPLRSGLTRSTVLAVVRGTARATIILKIKFNNPQMDKL
ncbi:hypothetical protein [Ralstonia solanacearum]|uniref:hypothetical protein n=2 Tax=Ralstonia solanacearum TaxID=305 RepID=UPI0018B02B73|nr:hypothetical protein [Ralstonia solanacearum]MDD7799442.1 hypothetical protein [Ralstonia solanacearum]